VAPGARKPLPTGKKNTSARSIFTQINHGSPEKKQFSEEKTSYPLVNIQKTDGEITMFNG